MARNFKINCRADMIKMLEDSVADLVAQILWFFCIAIAFGGIIFQFFREMPEGILRWVLIVIGFVVLIFLGVLIKENFLQIKLREEMIQDYKKCLSE